jgi:4-alpha-glucanotransferase
LSRFHLVLLIHAHQPVGNFDNVYEQTFQRSYLPFVQHLTRHPQVRLGLHYSGPLFEWFERRHPEFFDSLSELVARGQVEMVGGGFYEPILISIPPEDQAEQLARMSGYLKEKFGSAPTGAWLAERVWEPQLPYALSSSDVRYTLVDDAHFVAAGFELAQLHGDYVAEDRGRTVRVFPGLKALRYLLPFSSIEEVLGLFREYSEAHPGGMAAMGDDCEKFGAWPGTYEHCYGDIAWVERFFAALEAASDWLVTTPPGEWVASHPPLGRADLPTASYTEMMQWSLPTAALKEFRAISDEFALRPDVLRFLRGGHWRGFFTKYPESSLLHQKMLRVSGQTRGLASRRLGKRQRATLARARTHLLRAQCNDAYWHGVFGGLYAPHLRTELWRELVRAEALADDVATPGSSALQVERRDFDADGAEELYVTSPRLAALLQPSGGGTLGVLDDRRAGATLINSMQRRVEAYHSRFYEVAPVARGRVGSIHDHVLFKESGLERFLRYDRWPRSSFRVLLFSAEKTFEDYCELRLDEHAALAGGAYALREGHSHCFIMDLQASLSGNQADANGLGQLRCTKHFSFTHEGEGFRVNCATQLILSGASAFRGQVGIELVLNFLAPDEPDRFFEISSSRHRLRWTADVPSFDVPSGALRLVDEWQNVAATIEAPSAAHFWIAPIETVSESEEGFERVYQGSQILMVWPVELAATEDWRGEVALRIEPAR